nr:DUF294 nucleotidyltransferase-like domain-containing protein [Salinivibrio sp. MA427]
MATNPEWRKTLKQWEQCFADWIDNPSPRSLLDSNIFFDLDGVHGRQKAIIATGATTHESFKLLGPVRATMHPIQVEENITVEQ